MLGLGVAAVLVAAVVAVLVVRSGGGDDQAAQDLGVALRREAPASELRTLVTEVGEPDEPTASLSSGDAEERIELGDEGWAAADLDLDEGDVAVVDAATRSGGPARGRILGADGDAPDLGDPIEGTGEDLTLLVFTDAAEASTVEVSVRGVQTERLELSEPTDGTIEAAGDIAEFEVSVTAGEHYVIEPCTADGAPCGESDEVDLEVSVRSEDGDDLEITRDLDGDLRFVAASSGLASVRLDSGPTRMEGDFSIEVYELAHVVWFYASEGDDEYIEPTSDPDFDINDWADPPQDGFEVCLFIREDISVTITGSATSNDEATPEVAELDVNRDDGSGHAGALVDRIVAPDPGGTLTWTSADDQDRYFCLRAWVASNPSDFTYSLDTDIS